MIDLTFEEVIAKLAAAPEKVALLQNLRPNMLLKEAAVPQFLTTLLGAATKQHAGTEKVLQGLAIAGGAAALTGAGSALYSWMSGHKEETAKAHALEAGKIHAQQQVKTEQLLALKPQHDKVWSTLQKDEVLDKADKTMIRSAFDTMKRFAPNLAADENAARSFLREHAIYGTGPSYASLKNLVDAESAVIRAGGMTG